MSDYDDSCRIEKEGLKILMPMVRLYSPTKEPTYHADQHNQTYKGDFTLYNNGSTKLLEIKTEEKYTGNLFIEIWSNKSTENPGWLYKLRVDYLWYQFLSTDTVYTMIFNELHNFMHEQDEEGRRRIDKAYLIKQSKYDQLNDTWGVLQTRYG